MAPLYEDQHVQVFFRDGPGERTLITFNPVFQLADGAGFWARPVAERLDLRCIGIMAKRAEWFPAAHMADALAVILPLRRGRVSLYGASMGAYGALKYSARLGAETIIAFSPQATIVPTEVPFQTYHQYFRPDLHADMAIKPEDVAGRAYIFYDHVFAEDRYQAGLIPRWAGRRDIDVPFTRHATGVIAAGTAIIDKIFEHSALDDTNRLTQLMRQGKRNNWAIYYGLGLYCVERRSFARVAGLASRAAALGAPANMLAHLHGMFSMALARAERHEEALAAIETAHGYQPDDEVLARLLAEAKDHLAAPAPS